MNFLVLEVRNMVKKTALLVFVLLSLLSSVFYCYAVDLDYMDETKWYHNDKILSKNIDMKCKSNSIDGVFRYFYNENDKCFYIMLLATESSIENDKQDVAIEYYIDNEYNNYNFNINSDGLVVETEYAGMFNEKCNFSVDSDGTVRCICAVEIDNKSLTNYVTIKAHINNDSYMLLENFAIETPVANDESTTKSVKTTKKATTEKSKTKSKSSTKSSSKSTKSSAATTATTKFYDPDFVVSADEFSSYGSDTGEDAETDEDSGLELDDTDRPTGELSIPTIILLVIAGCAAFAGLTYIVNALVTRAAKKDKIDQEKAAQNDGEEEQ